MNSLPSVAELTQSLFTAIANAAREARLSSDVVRHNKQNALFHGGPWNGMRRWVDPRQKYIRVADPDRRPLPVMGPGDITTDMTFKIACYERRMFRNENRIWLEYFLEGEGWQWTRPSCFGGLASTSNPNSGQIPKYAHGETGNWTSCGARSAGRRANEDLPETLAAGKGLFKLRGVRHRF